MTGKGTFNGSGSVENQALQMVVSEHGGHVGVDGAVEGDVAVSYTHLTLPTIYSV